MIEAFADLNLATVFHGLSDQCAGFAETGAIVVGAEIAFQVRVDGGELDVVKIGTFAVFRMYWS